MHIKNKKNWIVVLLITAIAVFVGGVTSVYHALILLLGAISLYTYGLRYAAVAKQLHAHVNQQASAQNISSTKMFGKVLQKTFLYIFLPALLITVILLVVGAIIAGE